jgi:hypothetical protein
MSFHPLATTRRVASATTIVAISALAAALLGACSGVPLTSIPRLLRLSSQLLDANPAEFMVAIQLDARMAPAPGGVPVMETVIEPAVPGAFEVVNKKLPMRLVNGQAGTDTTALRSFGLQAAPTGRRWLIYSFTPESQAELVRIQTAIKRLQQDKQAGSGPGKGGGKITVGIAQEGIAASDPAFASTRWESWLQTRQSEGFYELWSGTVGALLKQAGRPKAESADAR